MKINESRLKEAITDKYGTQVKFAAKMGLSEGQVSRGIRSQSSSFLSILKKGGIDIDSLMLDEEGKKKDNIEYYLKNAEKRIKELEALLVQKDNLIKSYELVMKEQFKEKK
ncbi:MAG: DUF739 family protein [Ignavibacteriaceae bacterium]